MQPTTTNINIIALIECHNVSDTRFTNNACLGTFVVLYADDILLLAPSVALLQSLLQQCENELNLIDMAINTKKSSACVLVQEMTTFVLK